MMSFLPSPLGFALGSFLFGSTAGSTEVKPCRVLLRLADHLAECESIWQHSPGDVEVVEKLSLGKAFLQEAVGLFGPHLGHRTAAFSRRHVRPLHQTAYASHAAAGSDGLGWERVTEGFVRASGQRKSLD